MGGLTCGGELATGGGGFVVIMEFNIEMQATCLDIHVSISLRTKSIKGCRT